MKHWKNWLPGLALAGLLSGCSTANSTRDIAAVTPFDASRYLGEWYEIARLPQSFEEGLNGVRAEYSLREDGKIQVVNSGIDAGGATHSARATAKLAGSAEVGELEVCFFWPFYGAYRIIELDSEYTIATVTGSHRDALWILSRTPTIPAEALRERIEQARQWGFATDQLIIQPGQPE